eukprot:gnl/TRDRNA2_/TRDRNA2_182100_c0_seq1.p1 gnl/TRDRNA2_/TRDRNA2_182100_c0~~gnl/TRDRNA2_/TRDRNA2_182100_c0_seq1.p1  ORF type:complete len:232 (-),score=72.72 gnl/TRDRNA2_/TRDRNA2_182100_c0_seq1:88-783(-)
MYRLVCLFIWVSYLEALGDTCNTTGADCEHAKSIEDDKVALLQLRTYTSRASIAASTERSHLGTQVQTATRARKLIPGLTDAVVGGGGAALGLSIQTALQSTLNLYIFGVKTAIKMCFKGTIKLLKRYLQRFIAHWKKKTLQYMTKKWEHAKKKFKEKMKEQKAKLKEEAKERRKEMKEMKAEKEKDAKETAKELKKEEKELKKAAKKKEKEDKKNKGKSDDSESDVEDAD